MDEPFGALDPITRFRLQNELRRLHREVGKTVIFVTHDIDEAIRMGDRIAILREGGVLAQYDTPDAILAHPADDFVAQFIGEDRALRRLALRTLADVHARAGFAERSPAPASRADTTVRNAVSLMLETERATRSSWSTASRSRRLPAGATRETCCEARIRPGHPELRPGQRVRHGRPHVLLGLGAEPLERHARSRRSSSISS